MKYKLIVILSVWILLSGSFFYWAGESDFGFVPEGYNFCLDKGYDSTSLDGSYSEKFGKVKCMSCYSRECIYEEFNVTKKFGIVMDVLSEKTE